MQQLLRYINSDVAGRAAELANLWSLLADLDQQSYIVRAIGGPRSAAHAPAGQEIGTALQYHHVVAVDRMCSVKISW